MAKRIKRRYVCLIKSPDDLQTEGFNVLAVSMPAALTQAKRTLEVKTILGQCSGWRISALWESKHEH